MSLLSTTPSSSSQGDVLKTRQKLPRLQTIIGNNNNSDVVLNLRLEKKYLVFSAIEIVTKGFIFSHSNNSLLHFKGKLFLINIDTYDVTFALVFYGKWQLLGF